jgi:cytochrome c5
MLHIGCEAAPKKKGSAAIRELNPERAAELPTSELAEGRRLYEIKCAKCHRFYDPAEYGRSEWDLWMKKMSRKAHLSPGEEQTLTRYLDLFRPASTARKEQ